MDEFRKAELVGIAIASPFVFLISGGSWLWTAGTLIVTFLVLRLVEILVKGFA